MKTLPILNNVLLLLSIPQIPSPFIVPLTYNNEFDYVEIPPFSSQDETITVLYSCKSTSGVGKQIKVYIPKYGDHGEEQLVYQDKFTSRAYSTPITFSHNLDDDVNQVSVRFLVYEIGELLTDTTFKAYYRKMGASTLMSSHPNFTSRNETLIYTKADGETYVSEKYEFEGFSSVYSPRYNIFNLEDFKIKYTAPKSYKKKERPLLVEKCSIIIDDPEHLLDEVGEYDPPYIRSISFSLEKGSDNYYHPVWDQTFYVNPLTLRMSNTPLDGYVETNKFYFPRELNNLQDSLDIRFIMSKSGLNKETFYQRIKIENTNNLFGFCGVGEYCISSNSGTPNFEIGESVTYNV